MLYTVKREIYPWEGGKNGKRGTYGKEGRGIESVQRKRDRRKE
jgi:hypothetical protein